MAFPLKQMKWLAHEFGLASLHSTGRDAYIIILSRCTRMLAYGTNSLILALFFSELDFSDEYIGLFMTLTLLGDVLLSLSFTLGTSCFRTKLMFFLGGCSGAEGPGSGELRGRQR